MINREFCLLYGQNFSHDQAIWNNELQLNKEKNSSLGTFVATQWYSREKSYLLSMMCTHESSCYLADFISPRIIRTHHRDLKENSLYLVASLEILSCHPYSWYWISKLTAMSFCCKWMMGSFGEYPLHFFRVAVTWPFKMADYFCGYALVVKW